LVPAELAVRQQRLLERFGLPVAMPRWPAADLLAAMRSDKKSVAGRLRLVLPRRLGEVAVFDDASEAEVAAVLEECMA
jgi:3-dehydroquinate synthase